MTKSRLIVTMLGAAALTAALGAGAADYPARPIRVIVPQSAGGSTDVAARVLTDKLTESLKQNIVVDNRPGAGSLNGTETVAKSAPDGYTLLLAFIGPVAISPALTKVSYDSVKDFAPVALVAAGQYMLVLHPSVPAKSLKDFVAYAKANPGRINYASAGNGSPLHLAAELFKARAGVNMVHVPYKGGNPAMADLLGGRVQVFFSTVAVARPHLQAGKIRGLGVTTAKRTPALPNVPTIADSGLPGYAVSGWYGIVAPRGTPKAAIDKLHAAVLVAVRQPDIRDKLLGVGVEATEVSPAEFGRLIDTDIVRWNKVAKPLNIIME
jgi:tripartite-type tricarboxylate transporter receptor subunit TctC